MSIFLYLHTIRHLRPCQIYGRLLRSIRVPRPSTGSPPPRRRISGQWVKPARRDGMMLGPARFRFLNEVRDLDGKEGWNDPGARKLWLYNLHYFDDLNARDPVARREWHAALIRRWIDENPPAGGNGWEPFPTSLRIVNWVKWALGGGVLMEEAAHSLAIQARCLDRNLETHLLGNHLFSNAKALVFAGLYFEGEEAGRWLSKGLSLLRREVPEQILRDGGHFERSPMYHAMIMEDLLDLINLSRAYGGAAEAACGGIVPSWEETAERMGTWLRAMCHPDGEIALVNDAAFGIAPAPAELDGYTERLGFGPFFSTEDGVAHLAESGYIRLQGGEAVLLIDAAPLGPDYLPGHGHADTLSFELSLHGRRVIVDTGTSCYEEGPERMYQRGTAAHNTVVVDGADSSEVWGSFRVARRAKPFGLKIEKRKGETTVECAHDGYRRLPGRVVHRRKWIFGGGRLRVEDSLEGRFRSAKVRFLLHPEIARASGRVGAAEESASSGSWTPLPGPVVRWRVENGRGRLEKAFYHPEFGVSAETLRLAVDFPGPNAAFEMAWD